MIPAAKDKPFNQINFSGVPNMSGTLSGWFQPLTINVITKVIENFEVHETTTDVTFRGVWQPFSPKQLEMKPEGQRSWSWYMVHTQTDLKLKNDDVIKYRGHQYRVMANNNYNEYGFYEYHIIRDYEGAGPEVIPPTP